jgi:hypothetical protein
MSGLSFKWRIQLQLELRCYMCDSEQSAAGKVKTIKIKVMIFECNALNELMQRLSLRISMTVRKVIFCDICNPRGLKTVELRRGEHRENGSVGRRITENRAWIEGEITDAVENGWLCTPEKQHICPICRVNNESSLKIE